MAENIIDRIIQYLKIKLVKLSNLKIYSKLILWYCVSLTHLKSVKFLRKCIFEIHFFFFILCIYQILYVKYIFTEYDFCLPMIILQIFSDKNARKMFEIIYDLHIFHNNIITVNYGTNKEW